MVFPKPSRSIALVALLGVPWLFMAAAGCTSQKPVPFGVPGVAVTSGHYAGSPLTGPVDKAIAPGRPEDALAVRVAVIAVDQFPRLPANSKLAVSEARLIAVTRSGVPVQAEARLTHGARLAEGLTKDVFANAAANAKAQTADLGEIAAALPAGVTAWFEVSAADNGAVAAAVKRFAGQPLHRQVGVQLHRVKAAPAAGGAAAGGAADALQLAIVIEDLVTPTAPLDTTQGKTAAGPKGASKEPQPTTVPAPSPTVVHELLLIDRPPLKGPEQFALILPCHFENSAVQALAIFISLDKGSGDSAHLEAYADCLKDLTGSLSSARAAAQPFRAEVDSPEWPSLSTALDAMARPGAPRQAMLYLAGQTNVEVLGDVALIADDPTRQELAKKVVAKVGAPAKVKTREGLAWVLENATFELLSEQSAAGKLAPELSATLAMHAGEAGRHPGALDEGLKTCANRQEFAVRLIAENYIYLEDSSPASRVRAYDWLLARDRAPAGFDPLGPPRERRAALERALGAAAKPQAGAGGVP
jgi:hypothetical protein